MIDTVSLSESTISINNVNYRLEDIEGTYMINRQMLKLYYAFLGLFVLVLLVIVAFTTLFGITSVPGNVIYFVLILMVYPSFLIGRTILKKFYFPELILTVDGKVVFRIVEWPRYRSVVETIKGRVIDIKISYRLNPLAGRT